MIHFWRRFVRTLCVHAFTLGVALLTLTAVTSTPSHVSIEASDEPVQSVLLRLAHIAHASIVVEPGVSGFTTISLQGVTLAYALDAILRPLGDTYLVHGGVYQIKPLPGDARVQSNAETVQPAVLSLSVIPASRAAAQLHALFPQDSIRTDAHANAVVVIASAADLQSMRAVIQGLDVRDPLAAITEAIAVKALRVPDALARLQATFPRAKFVAASPGRIFVTATAQDLTQIKNALNALDMPDAAPPPISTDSEAVRVTQRAPRDVARTVEGQVPGVRAAVSGSTVVLSGPSDLVQRAKTLIGQVDVPLFDARYTQVYRLRTIDAASVAGLLRRSFTGIDVTTDTSTNAIAVVGTAAQHQRIADALSQLDPAPGSNAGLPGTASFAGASTEVVTLKSYVPGQSQGGTDAVQTITQALQAIAPDVKVITLSTPGQIALVGSVSSLRVARDFIDKIDIVPPLVILDTEVLEIDDSVTKDLGLELGTTSISTTYTETTPPPNSAGVSPKLGKLQSLTRTPISFQATLNLALQNGKGRVLADPRITTLSGRTASIRAGDTISILTTTSGNAGTIATTQIQSFQTGVTLDITPSVTPDGGVTVALHPVVNSLAGTNNGVPEISTRDTQTTVHLQDNQTLVIGGLIQENDTRTTTKVPGLGDIPLLGKLFTSNSIDNTRNELVIVVTPHIVRGPGDTVSPGPTYHAAPSPEPFPTLPPGTTLPPPSANARVASAQAQPVSMATPLPTVAQQTALPTLVAGSSPGPASSPTATSFTYGSVPMSNAARPRDPAQIFAATLTPTTLSNGSSVRVTATTTTNVTAVKISIGSVSISLGQTGFGTWSGSFPFPANSLPPGQSSASLFLTAIRGDGETTSITIPVTVSSP